MSDCLIGSGGSELQWFLRERGQKRKPERKDLDGLRGLGGEIQNQTAKAAKTTK
jgi:hypothetical protein